MPKSISKVTTKPSMSLKPVLEFLSELREHNHKAWFEQNRLKYEQARENFENFVDLLISEIEAFENLHGVTAKSCIFRINRDLRFSKDKIPYKTNMAANLAPGGRNSGQLGYYVHLQPHNQSMLAGGLYMPTSAELAKFRQALDRDAATFKKIINAKGFRHSFGALEGARLRTAPQGYARDHPDLDLLQLKQVTVIHRLADKQVLAPDFSEYAVQVFRAIKPFLDYLNRVKQ